MFTGIIEMVGVVDKLEEVGDKKMFTVHANGFFSDVKIGGSIAINGVCLTIVSCNDDFAVFEVAEETISRSSFGNIEVSDSVNLEKAMSSSGRFDGHIVQGHVDVVAKVDSIESGEGVDTVINFSLPFEFTRYIVEKGSITVNGVSLTVTGVSDSTFSVMLISHTMSETNLGVLKNGDIVNIEVDVIGKYVEKMMKV